MACFSNHLIILVLQHEPGTEALTLHPSVFPSTDSGQMVWAGQLAFPEAMEEIAEGCLVGGTLPGSSV